MGLRTGPTKSHCCCGAAQLTFCDEIAASASLIWLLLLSSSMRRLSFSFITCGAEGAQEGAHGHVSTYRIRYNPTTPGMRWP